MKKTQSTIVLFIIIVCITSWWKFKNEFSNQYNYKSISYYQTYSLKKPKQIFFCGEKIPVENKEVQKKIDRAIFHYSSLHRKTSNTLQKINKWFPKLSPIVEKHKLPKDLLYYSVVESDLTNSISPKDAAGFWQLIPSTAEELGLTINDSIDDRLDPYKSTHAACKFYKSAYSKFNNWANTAAAYNMGITGFLKQIKRQNRNSYFELKLNRETGNYVYRAIALKEIVENKTKYGYRLEEIHYHEILENTEPDFFLLSKPILFW